MCPIVRVCSSLCAACLSMIDKGGWSASCHSLFQCLWIGGCVGPRAGLGAMESCTVQELNPGDPVCRPLLFWLSWLGSTFASPYNVHYWICKSFRDVMEDASFLYSWFRDSPKQNLQLLVVSCNLQCILSIVRLMCQQKSACVCYIFNYIP
jgi:hypothetical protein